MALALSPVPYRYGIVLLDENYWYRTVLDSSLSIRSNHSAIMRYIG